MTLIEPQSSTVVALRDLMRAPDSQTLHKFWSDNSSNLSPEGFPLEPLGPLSYYVGTSLRTSLNSIFMLTPVELPANTCSWCAFRRQGNVTRILCCQRMRGFLFLFLRSSAFPTIGRDDHVFCGSLLKVIEEPQGRSS